MSKYDVIIIGAGIMGAATAYELAKKGYKVVVIEKNAQAGTGSTAGSCAIVRAHYSTYQGVAMAYEGFFYWLNWEDYLGVKDPEGMARYMNCGSILLKTKGHNYRKVLEHFRAAGVKHEEWTLEQLRENMPLYNHKAWWPPSRPEDTPDYWDREPTDTIDGAVFTPESGYVDRPDLATRNMIHAAKAHGAELMTGRRVVQIHREGNRVQGVSLDNAERIDAPIVVNAAGPHSFIINRMAGIEEGMRIKTRALRHEVHHVPSPPGFNFEHDGYHTSDGDNGIYFRPCVNNTILVGSEDPKCDPQEWIENPDVFNREVTDAQWAAQVSRLVRRFTNMSMPEKKMGFAELYDVSDDWIPIYDKSDLDGFYLCIGTSGNQFKNGPVVGYCMSELIDRCEKGQDHDADPVIVKAVYTGLELNMQQYSRRREINPESSFSVNG
ncbi:MAG TPA: FAD-dependent oxidoreductase [Candidatus Sumerlaeota bacterium]|nr:FAD-dependent oxidoreductase [Candidatus Sumerlaeota bacterium]HPK01212.1 FAD-dependent oxidoreductase [Candidatus Sumerlaeota bacterium]